MSLFIVFFADRTLADRFLEHFSHRYTLAEDGEVQLSLMESCQSFCASVYT
jgi:hypothetical protein